MGAVLAPARFSSWFETGREGWSPSLLYILKDWIACGILDILRAPGQIGPVSVLVLWRYGFPPFGHLRKLHPPCLAFWRGTADFKPKHWNPCPFLGRFVSTENNKERAMREQAPPMGLELGCWRPWTRALELFRACLVLILFLFLQKSSHQQPQTSTNSHQPPACSWTFWSPSWSLSTWTHSAWEGSPLHLMLVKRRPVGQIFAFCNQGRCSQERGEYRSSVFPHRKGGLTKSAARNVVNTDNSRKCGQQESRKWE